MSTMHRHWRAAGVLLAWLAILPVPPAHGREAAAVPEAQFDALITETMRGQKIPAITVAAANADRILYSRAFGSADLENSVAATPETLIRTASIAKSITAVAAMTLVESGKLDLDAPVQTYCPPFPPRQWPITTRELLAHTSGIRHYNPGEMENTRHYRFMADGFAIFAADPLLFRPGTGYQYSTYGYTVVGCVIEGAAGERFQDYVAAHVLGPAGMTQTRVDDAHEIVPHRARGYQKIGSEIWNADLMDSSYKIPGGGYLTTAEDLVRFAQALTGGRLVKPASLAQLWTPTPVSGKESYGLGFQVLEGGRLVMHTGGQPGTTTILVLAPQQRLALAVLANMDGVQLRELVRAIATRLEMPLPPLTAAADQPGIQGGVFRVTPVRPVAELLPAALGATPPVESGEFRAPDLVELTTLDPTIRLDIRYASTRNFLGTPLYSQARAFLQRPAAEALLRVQHSLSPEGYGLLVHDAYRPWYVTRIFWDAMPPELHKYVADPAQGSRHNRGCAVDLTLYNLKTGRPVEMPSVYDEATERAYPSYTGGTAAQRAARDLLRRHMEAEGFTVYEFEWWHFDYRDWQAYAIQNVRFEDIGKR